MDFRTLKTFQAIVSTGSFNKAAEELNYAQSTVTMQIQKLEAQLGVQLLERGKQQICLTEAGRLFYEQSLHILKHMERLQSSLADLQAGGAGNVRIGVTDPTASYRLPELLRRFMDLYPRIELSVEIAGTTALCEQLLRGELDMILCSAPQLGTELHFEPLFIEEFVLLPLDHPLAGESEITADQLRGHRLLITAAGCPYRKKLESVLQESAGPSLNTMEIGSMTSLKFYVESGIGMAFVPWIMLQPLPAGTVVRKLSGAAIDMSCGIACRIADYPLKPASLSLYQFLKTELTASGTS